MGDSELQPGDVVCIKSGGPPMTIESITDGRAMCVWFLEGRKLVESFDLVAIEHVP